MIRNKVLTYVFFITCIFSLSCSGSSADKVSLESSPDNNNNEIWNTLSSSTNATISNTEIQKIISDLSSNTSNFKMYKGSGSLDVLTLKEQDMGDYYSFVYMLGGLSIEGVSAEDYFNMMKLQATKDDSFSTDNGYELDKEVTYNYKSSKSTDSKIRYKYEKKTIVGENDNVLYYYDGIANFIKLSDELYVVVNTLDEKDNPKKGEVVTLYSISVISGSSTSVSVYLGMEQKANNHTNHASSVKNTKSFFQEDAKRSYNNAKNYTSRKK